jgi:hypothetical protein
MNPGPIEIKIDISPRFAKACEEAAITPQAALQQFIDHLSVHTHLASSNGSQAVAVTLFKAFIDQRGFIPPPDAARKLHTRCVQQLVRLIRGKSSPEKKEQAYQRLINEWSNSLTETQ